MNLKLKPSFVFSSFVVAALAAVHWLTEPDAIPTQGNDGVPIVSTGAAVSPFQAQVDSSTPIVEIKPVIAPLTTRSLTISPKTEDLFEAAIIAARSTPPLSTSPALRPAMSLEEALAVSQRSTTSVSALIPSLVPFGAGIGH